MTRGDAEAFVLYDRQAVLALVDDPGFVEEVREGIWPGEGEPTEERVWDEAYERADLDLAEEVRSVSDRLDERVGNEHPEWGRSYLLMVRGTVGRWDGVSAGHNYYAGEPARRSGTRRLTPFEQLVSDTGWDGLFRDCEIDRIWEDRGGTVHVEGVHHDGRVEVACRAVGPDTEQDELDSRDWDGTPGPATRRIVEGAWETGVRADMASLYGHDWPGADLAEQLAGATAPCGPSAPARHLEGEAR